MKPSSHYNAFNNNPNGRIQDFKNKWDRNLTLGEYNCGI